MPKMTALPNVGGMYFGYRVLHYFMFTLLGCQALVQKFWSTFSYSILEVLGGLERAKLFGVGNECCLIDYSQSIHGPSLDN